MAIGTEVTGLEMRGDVALLTMERPPANALGRPLYEALSAALDEIAAVGSARAIVIGSAIEGFFAAGADLKYIATLDAGGFARYRDRLREPLDRLAGLGIPSVAAIDGLALGGGLELAMACTLRVAGEQSRLGLPEIRLGLIPGAGGTQRLPPLVGRGRALELMLTGREAGAEEAARIGLVDVLVPSGTATEAALALATRIAGYPAPAAAAIIRSVGAAYGEPATGMAVEGEAVVTLFAEGVATPGIEAFLARRGGESR